MFGMFQFNMPQATARAAQDGRQNKAVIVEEEL